MALSLPIILASCCKDDKIIHEISNELINSIRYYHGQIVKFRSSSGELITTEVATELLETNFGGETCRCCTKELYQDYHVSLYSANYRWMHFNCDYNSDGVMNFTILSERYNDGISAASSFEYFVNSAGAFICEDYIYCHDTFTINNSVYNNVIEIKAPPLTVDVGLNYIIQVFYSMDKGVLKYVHKDSTQFILEE